MTFKYYETPFSVSMLCPMTHTLMIIDSANYAESWLPRIDPWALQPEYKIFLILLFRPNKGFTKIRPIYMTSHRQARHCKNS